jgi:hypothetical protein
MRALHEFLAKYKVHTQKTSQARGEFVNVRFNIKHIKVHFLLQTEIIVTNVPLLQGFHSDDSEQVSGRQRTDIVSSGRQTVQVKL